MTTTTTDAPSVQWNRRFDIFVFAKRGYWVRAVDLAGDEFADTMAHLRSQAWWSPAYEADLRKAIQHRRRELRKPIKAKLHSSKARRLAADFLAGFRRWALAREHSLTVDEVSEVLRQHGIRPSGRRTPPAKGVSR